MRIPILKSILRNLDWFEEAQKHHKAPEGTIFVGGINHRVTYPPMNWRACRQVEGACDYAKSRVASGRVTLLPD